MEWRLGCRHGLVVELEDYLPSQFTQLNLLMVQLWQHHRRLEAQAGRQAGRQVHGQVDVLDEVSHGTAAGLH